MSPENTYRSWSPYLTIKQQGSPRSAALSPTGRSNANTSLKHKGPPPPTSHTPRGDRSSEASPAVMPPNSNKFKSLSIRIEKPSEEAASSSNSHQQDSTATPGPPPPALSITTPSAASHKTVFTPLSRTVFTPRSSAAITPAPIEEEDIAPQVFSPKRGKISKIDMKDAVLDK